MEGDPTDEGFVAVTTTLPSQDPCRFSRLGEVEGIVRTTAGLDVVEGRCRFDLHDGAVAELEVRPLQQALGDVVHRGIGVADIGDDATWGATPDGGTLAIAVDDQLVLLSVVLPDDPDRAFGIAQTWGSLVAPRVADATEATADVPGAGPLEPCGLLGEDARADVLGPGWKEEPSTDPSVCALRSPQGVQVLVGPLVRPGTQAQVEDVTRMSGSTEWPRTPVDVGDVGVLLTDPTEPGIVSLTAIEGVEALRVEVRGGDGEESRRLASDVAEAVLAARSAS